ncbi:SRPBCC domain-containing protein [Devosia ginsengisoli]|uniref:SRPBCC family protein n=1 Tax=Devosia ginsengisoli TaxID=400770 RepID=UPI0026F04A3F|nr:SRPBCC domain-containing protein [Devosia ginsengisoli]MCR6672447.1 SRPBCC domain-containing protein [Devosia ginsengisoli]
MVQASEPRAGTIRLERVYDASIEDVWALWTTKEGLEQWFAPEGMRFEVSVLDLRVGGTFDHVMTAVGAEQVAYMANLNRPSMARVSGRFVDIVPHRRLRIRFDIDFVPGVESYPYDMMVELHTEAGRVRMVLTADRHPDAEMTRGAIIGLTSQLQRFDLAIAARAAKEQRP